MDDISDLSHGERFHHYLDSYGGDDINARAQAYQMAHNQATADMLDEIHAMLRHTQIEHKERKNETT